jgi:hypothetical protein
MKTGRKPKYALNPNNLEASVRAMIALENPIEQRKIVRRFSSRQSAVVMEVIYKMEAEGIIEVIGKGTKASPNLIIESDTNPYKTQDVAEPVTTLPETTEVKP